jgi:hypothetical protein
MSTNHHTPHAFGFGLTSAELERPHGELDAAVDLVITTGSGASTTLTAQANSGQKNLTVASGAGFANGDAFWIGDSGGTFESGSIASGGGTGTLVAVANLLNTYAIGKPVSKSPIELVDARAGAATLGARLNALGTKATAAVRTTTDLVATTTFIPATTDQHLNSVAFDGRTVLTGSYPGGQILRSNDLGLSFDKVGQVNASVDDVFFLKAAGPGLFYAGCSMTGTAAALFRSVDGGLSWHMIFQAASTAEASEGLSIEAGHGKVILIGSANQVAGGGAKIWRSVDGGISWSNVSSTEAGKITIRQIRHIVDQVYIATVRGSSPNEVKIFRSINAGATFASVQTISGDEVWTALGMPNSVSLLGMNSGKIYRSTDGGASYAQIVDLSSGGGGSTVFGLTRAGNTVLAFVNQDANTFSKVYASGDEGLTWIEVGTLNAAYHYHEPAALDWRTIVLAGSNNTPGSAGRISRAAWYG